MSKLTIRGIYPGVTVGVMHFTKDNSSLVVDESDIIFSQRIENHWVEICSYKLEERDLLVRIRGVTNKGTKEEVWFLPKEFVLPRDRRDRVVDVVMITDQHLTVRNPQQNIFLHQHTCTFE